MYVNVCVFCGKCVCIGERVVVVCVIVVCESEDTRGQQHSSCRLSLQFASRDALSVIICHDDHATNSASNWPEGPSCGCGGKAPPDTK